MPSQEYFQLILIFLQLVIAFSTAQRLKESKEGKDKIITEEDEKNQTAVQKQDSIQKQESSSLSNQHSNNIHQDYIPMTPVFVQESKSNKVIIKTFEQDTNQYMTKNERSKGKGSNKQQKYLNLQNQIKILNQKEKEQQEEDELLKRKLWVPYKQSNMSQQGDSKDKNRLFGDKDGSQGTRKRPRIADKYDDIDSDDMIDEGRESQYSVNQVYKVIKKRKDDRIAKIDEEKEEIRRKEMQLMVQKQQQEKIMKQQLEMLRQKKEQKESLLASTKLSQQLPNEIQDVKNEIKGDISPQGNIKQVLLQPIIHEVKPDLQEIPKRLLNILDQTVKNDKIPQSNQFFQGLLGNNSQVGGQIVKDGFLGKQSQGIDSVGASVIGDQVNSEVNIITNNKVETQKEDITQKQQPKLETEQPSIQPLKEQETNKQIEDVKNHEETSIQNKSQILGSANEQDNKSNVDKEPIKEVSQDIKVNDSKENESDNNKNVPQNIIQEKQQTEKEQTTNKTEAVITAKSESDQSVSTQAVNPIGNFIFAQPSRGLPQKNSIISLGSSSLFGNNSSSLFPGNNKSLDIAQSTATTTDQSINGQQSVEIKPSVPQSEVQKEQLNSTSALEEKKDQIIPKPQSLFSNIASSTQNATSKQLFSSLINNDNGINLTSTMTFGATPQPKLVEQNTGLFGGNLNIQNSQLNAGDKQSNKSDEIKEGQETTNTQISENSLNNQEKQPQSKDLQTSSLFPSVTQVKPETNQSSLFTKTPVNGSNPLTETTQKITSTTSIFANNPSKLDATPSLFSGLNNANTQSKSLFGNLQGTGLFQTQQISAITQPSQTQQQS